MGANNEKYKFLPDLSAGTETIPDPKVFSQFIQDFFAMKLPLVVRSQSVPTRANSPGTVIIHLNMNLLILLYISIIIITIIIITTTYYYCYHHFGVIFLLNL